MPELITMDHTGDTKLIWDPAHQDEVDNAKETFERLTKKGYLAYKVDASGEKGEVIKKFDPAAERIILAPPMRGG